MDKYQRRLLAAGTLIAGFLIFGTIFYRIVEGFTWVDAFYLTGVTLTTVGYGDVLPTHAISKIFSVFLAFMGIGIVFYSIGILAQHYFEQEEQRLARVWESTRNQSFPDVVSKGADAVSKGVSHVAKHFNDLTKQRRPDLFVPIDQLHTFKYRKKNR